MNTTSFIQVVFATVLISIALFTFGLFGYGWTWSIIVASLILYAGVSFTFQVVPYERTGAAFFLERPVANCEYGHFLFPLGLMRIRSAESGLNTVYAPDRAENIQRADTDTSPIPGKSYPTRVTTGSINTLPRDTIKDVYGDRMDEALLDPLSQRLTLEITGRLAYRVTDALHYFRELHSEEEADDVLREMFESIAAEEFGTRTPGMIVQDLQDINAIIERRIRGLSQSWGVELVYASLNEKDLTHEINKALRDHAEAIIGIKIAEAEAQGQKAKILAEYEAENAGQKGRLEVLKDAGSLGELIVKLEAATEIWKALANSPKGTNTITPGSQILDTVITSAEILSRKAEGK